MTQHVFISYSTKDKAIADAMCLALEKNGFSCWYAPRNVPPGTDWNIAILDAIAISRIMVLVFSSKANVSSDVTLEVKHAFRKKILVVPFRIEDVQPTKTLEYYLTFVQWLDAWTPPLEEHLQQLVEYLQDLTSTNRDREAIQIPSETSPSNPPETSPSNTRLNPVMLLMRRALHTNKAKRISLVIIAVLLATTMAYIFFKNRNLRTGIIDSNDGGTISSNGQEFTEPNLVGHNWWVNSIAVSPDGRTIASGSDDATVRLWEFQTGKLKQTMKASGNAVDLVVFSPDGKLLASQGGDNTAKIWDASSGELRQLLIGYHYYDGRSNYVSGLSFSPDSTVLASGVGEHGTIGKIRRWATDTGSVTYEWDVNKDNVDLVLYSPIDDTLASVDSVNRKYSVKIWDANTGSIKHILIKNSSMVSSICFSPDGKTLAISEEDGGISLWDIQTGRMKKGIGNFSATSMVFSPSGSVLVCGDELGTIEFWDVNEGSKIKVLRLEHAAKINSLAFSPSGKTLVSAGKEKLIRLWDVTDLKQHL